MSKTTKFNDYLIKSLKNPEEASVYLNVALEVYRKDSNIDAFLLALRDVAEAKGGLGRLAQKTKLNRQNLYKILSKEGNPRLVTLGNILNELGFHLSIEPTTKYSTNNKVCVK